LQHKFESKDENNSNGEHDVHEAHEQGKYDEKTYPRLRNLLIPLLFLISLITFLLWWTGHSSGSSFFQSIINSDYEKSIFVATIATLVFTALLYVFQKIPMKDIESSFLAGGVDLLPPIVILIIAWSITDVTEDLGFTTFISSLIKTSFPHDLVPLIVFLVGGLVSYFMGSSWGTWALIMPIAFTLIASTGASIPFTVGAVLAGGSIGDNLSPLGETPVTTSTIMGVPITEHIRYALPFGLIAILISALLYIITGYIF
jgi:Na+/H+ antiporter NhaC